MLTRGVNSIVVVVSRSETIHLSTFWNAWENFWPAATHLFSSVHSKAKGMRQSTPQDGWQVNVTQVAHIILSGYTVYQGVSLKGSEVW